MTMVHRKKADTQHLIAQPLIYENACSTLDKYSKMMNASHGALSLALLPPILISHTIHLSSITLPFSIHPLSPHSIPCPLLPPLRLKRAGCPQLDLSKGFGVQGVSAPPLAYISRQGIALTRPSLQARSPLQKSSTISLPTV